MGDNQGIGDGREDVDRRENEDADFHSKQEALQLIGQLPFDRDRRDRIVKFFNWAVENFLNVEIAAPPRD